ncbi:hypothetical protein ACLOJK_033939 [Asimina triloba]
MPYSLDSAISQNQQPRAEKLAPSPSLTIISIDQKRHIVKASRKVGFLKQRAWVDGNWKGGVEGKQGEERTVAENSDFDSASGSFIG